MLTRLHLHDFKNFQAATLPLGPLTLLLGANAAGKSNVRDALRFLHGIVRGYTLADTVGEKWGEGGVLQWRGLRGGTVVAARHGANTFTLQAEFTLGNGPALPQAPLGVRYTRARVTRQLRCKADSRTIWQIALQNCRSIYAHLY